MRIGTSNLCAVAVVIALPLSAGCTPDVGLMAKGSDFTPTFIRSAPRGDTVALVVSATTFDGRHMCGTPRVIENRDPVVSAFRSQLMGGLRSKGYKVTETDLSVPVCSFCTWTGKDACRASEMFDPAVTKFLRDRQLSTALSVAVDFGMSGKAYQIVGKSESAPVRRAILRGNLVDASGQVVHVFHCCGSEDVKLLDPDAKEERFVYRSPTEWGDLIAEKLLKELPNYGAAPIPGESRVAEALLARPSWRENWIGKMDRRGSGSHMVRFERRGAGLVARIGVDPALGNSPGESEVTVTPVGISYMVDNLGRVRLRLVDGTPPRFDGEVLYSIPAPPFALVSLVPE